MGKKRRKRSSEKTSDEDVERSGDSSMDSGDEPESGPTGALRLVPEPASEDISRAIELIDSGNNRAARKLLDSIDDDDEHVVDQRNALLSAIKPDPFALGVVLLGLIVALTAAILAFNR